MTKRLPIFILLLLVIQFLLGMLASFYQEIPKGIEKYQVYYHMGYILFHVIAAFSLVIAGTVIFINIVKNHYQKKYMILSLIGLLCIIIAFMSGVFFIEKENDLYSFIMASGFIGAMIPYAYFAFGPKFS
jgi:heme A synthase